MKKNWLVIIIVLIVIIGVVGYLGRHKIKGLLNGSSQTSMQPSMPTHMMQQSPSPTSASSAAMPSNNIYMTKTNPAKGTYLTDFQGMTLYIFDNDTAGVSNCIGNCAKIWPAYTSGATAQSIFPAHISVITRTDGSKQFAWDQKPLYYYASDTKAGDMNGDGVGNVWHIVKQ